MAKLMVVAGDNTKELVTFLDDKTTMEVEYSYPSLVPYQSELKAKFIQSDKLIYIQAKDPEVFREDTQVLRSLLTGSGYFYPKEMIFFTSKADESSSVIEALMYVVTNESLETGRRVPPYQEIVFQGELTFDKIYDAILGQVESTLFEDGMQSLFIVERGESAKNSYEAQDNSDLSYEPFNYQSVNTYENTKKNIANRLIGNEIQEEQVKALPKTNPVFGKLNLPQLESKICVAISGTPKTGSTTLSVAMSISLTNKLERVLLFDLSKTQGARYLMSSHDVAYVPMSCSSLLSGDIVRFSKGLTLVDGCPSKVRSKMVRYLSTNFERFDCDAIVINVDGSEFIENTHLLSELITKSFFTCIPQRPDILLAQEHLLGATKTEIVLYDPEHTNLSLPSILNTSVREEIPWIDAIWNPLIFKHLAVSPKLVEQLLGV